MAVSVSDEQGSWGKGWKVGRLLVLMDERGVRVAIPAAAVAEVRRMPGEEFTTVEYVNAGSKCRAVAPISFDGVVRLWAEALG